MANNYTLFSFAIPDLTETEAEWCEVAVAYLTDDSVDQEHDLAILLPDEYEDTEWLGYEVEVERDDLWFHTDESGDPANVVPFVQEFLRRFRPTDAVSVEYANTCSKPRLDEFAGGALFITADDVEFMHTGNWVNERHDAHAAATTADQG